MRMEIINFIFGIVVCFGQICSSVADCSSNTPGLFRFGPECQYMCHCKNGESCDATTGECSVGCDTNWFGPACQYRDLAKKQFSRQNTNQNPVHYSSNATDGDMSTCSKTQKNNLSTARPWWKMWLPLNETIRDIYILTLYSHLSYFRGFEVTVEYAPENKKKDLAYVPTYKHTCYTHSDTVPGSTSIYVQCDQPVVGNQVRIKLATVQSQLVLCDVKIGAGRNFAFRKPVTASQHNISHPPLNAVDGRFSTSGWDGCFVAETAGIEYLDINLGHSIDAYSVKINTASDDYIRDYQIYAATSGQTDLQLVYDDTGNTPSVTYVHLNTEVQQLRIQTNNDYRLIICELAIYGECPVNKCGYDCSENCYCYSYEDYEHRISGVCSTGCQRRWTGPNGKCNKECDGNKWGLQCQNDCGACRVGTCDFVSGECAGGCQDGYQYTTDCKSECEDGSYGIDCTQECASRCRDTCDKVNGHCSQCPPGWKGSFCETECDIGTYGIYCAGRCGFCKVHTSCDTETGICPSGCIDGYTGSTCDQDPEQLHQPNTVEIIAGIVAGIVVIICLTIVVVCVIMYRRRQPSPGTTDPGNRVEMSHNPTSASYEDLHQNAYSTDTAKEETIYETAEPE